MILASLHPATMLALFQSTQLNLFERFLTQARSGIDSTGITAGMQNVAYVVLLVGFLWQVYQSASHGGDVRGLGTSLIKYVVTAVVVMNYGAVFTTINQGFVSAGNWVSNASGGNVFQNWASDLKTQYSQAGFQQMWGLITGSIAGLIDGILVLVAYILYPIVVVVFGFFYMFYGSILYIFGPIVVALMPLDATNRLAKSYVENIFVWNAWPILYGGFGALLSAVQMGQVGQMLNQNDFLGGLGNLEGAFLLGIVSIVYSLAIAVIPFVAKRIVSGDVGSTAAAMIGAAVTAVTAGAAGIEGAAAGFAAVRTGAGGATGAGMSSSAATTGAARALPASTGGNLPAPPQSAPIAASSATGGFGFDAGAPTLEGHADLIRNSISNAMGTNQADEASGEAGSVSSGNSSPSQGDSGSPATKRSSNAGSSGSQRRGPSVHRYNVGTWGAYHAARLAASGVAKATRSRTDED
ncbi:MAG: type IV secretion system protein [Acidobacteria bacterium]|nr:type IV secretion system protein [Acidobacteriota bacterium]